MKLSEVDAKIDGMSKDELREMVHEFKDLLLGDPGGQGDDRDFQNSLERVFTSHGLPGSHDDVIDDSLDDDDEDEED